MSENQEATSDKVVVVTKANADDSDYLRAVVCTDEDSANEYVAELKATAPWHNHSVVSAEDFSAAKTDTGKDEK